MFAPSDTKSRPSRAALKSGMLKDAAAVAGKSGGALGKSPEQATARRPSQNAAASRPATYGAMKRWAKQLKVGSRTAGAKRISRRARELHSANSGVNSGVNVGMQLRLQEAEKDLAEHLRLSRCVHGSN